MTQPGARLVSSGTMSEIDDAPPTRDLVAGKYRLVRLLGRGGMGSVWEGVHASLGTRVAVKFIEREYADNEEARKRFDNEARAAARLESRHVVHVFDHGVTDDGKPYIVMEFLTGEPLDARLARVGRLSIGETSRLLGQVCRALARAHEAGIVHRDLKPENVYLVRSADDDDEIAKVLDFGIAKFGPQASGMSSSTRTGSILGTPHYMSPEQARGLRSVDHRTDLWSLGVIGYRCIVGTLPFQGEAMGDLLVNICTAPLPVPSQALPGLPPELDAWFARAVERDPARRYGSAAELAAGLQAAAAAVGEGPAPRFASAASIEAGPTAITPAPYGAGAPAVTDAAYELSRTSRGAGKGTVIVASVAGLAVLAIGAAVAMKITGGRSAAAASASGAVLVPTSSVTTIGASAAPVESAAGPTTTDRAEAPPATASAAAKVEAPPVSSAKPSARPTTKERPPVEKAKPAAEKANPATTTAKPKPGSTPDLGY